MRSRSSRLFIVLLHLVGVRTNLPLNSSFWKVGIVGVHPISITLDNLQLDPIGGLDGLLRKIPAELAESILGDPYWLQVRFINSFLMLANGYESIPEIIKTHCMFCSFST